MPKNAEIFFCKNCDFKCCKKSNYTKHLDTRKHKILTNPNKKMPKNAENNYYCKCGKNYKHSSSLSAHKNKCLYKECISINNINNINNPITDEANIIEANIIENNNLTKIVFELITNNKELQKQQHEFQEKMREMYNANANTNIISNNNSNNNSNNKTFNLQIFLNEQCKNAMNLSDFIDSIKLQMSDLESIGTLGYTEGMHNIIFKEFIDIELFNRPFHCSDLKREIIYIKNDNKWEKEDPENKKLKNAIRTIEKKNFKLLNEWAEQHPKINDYNSPDGDKYLKLLNHATSGDNDHMNKVIKKLVKNITIDKNEL